MKWTTTNHTRLVFIQRRWCCNMVGMEGSLLLWAPFQKTKQLILCSQLDQLKAAFDKTHPELVNGKFIIFHQDDPRLHVSLMTRQKLLQLGLEVLIHQPYSSDIAHLGLHLFQSLQNSLIGKNFNSLEYCKERWEYFFAQKDEKFLENEIMKLPGKWQKVMEQNSKCLIQ